MPQNNVNLIIYSGNFLLITLGFVFPPFLKQIFSNGDKVHVAKVLRKLGLEDCFEKIISFETLNPSNGSNISDDEDSFKLRGSSTQVLDATNCPCQSELPETPIICKPFENAFEQAFKIANINPQKNSKIIKSFPCTLLHNNLLLHI